MILLVGQEIGISTRIFDLGVFGWRLLGVDI